MPPSAAQIPVAEVEVRVGVAGEGTAVGEKLTKKTVGCRPSEVRSSGTRLVHCKRAVHKSLVARRCNSHELAVDRAQIMLQHVD